MTDEVTWFIYICRCNDDTLYTGITLDVERRIAQHNGIRAGGAKYTSGRRPIILVSTFCRPNKSEALKLEYRIKQLSKEEKLTFLDEGA